MHRIPLVIAFVAGLIGPALAQQAESEAASPGPAQQVESPAPAQQVESPSLAQQIEAANAKFIDFFNKSDFAGIGSLYSEDAAAFPPGASMVKGRAAIEAMWKGMGEEVTDPEVSTVEVKSLGPTAAQEFGQFSLKTKGSTPQEVTGKYVVIWEKVGDDWKIATDIWNHGN
jgi:ketosteroid isomerase-like protein